MGEHEQSRAAPGALRSKILLAALAALGVLHLAVINLVLAPKVETEFALAGVVPASTPPAVHQTGDNTGAVQRRLGVPTQPVPPASTPRLTATGTASVAPPLTEPGEGEKVEDAGSAAPTPRAVDSGVAEPQPKPPSIPVGPLRVGFATRSSEPTAEDKATIAHVAKSWKASPGLTVYVHGHTDQRGDFADNLVLSRRRAERVAEELMRAGVPSARIRIKAEGERVPLDQSDSPGAFAANRRAEILLR